MCKRNSPETNETSMGCVTETSQIINKYKKKVASMGRFRENPHIKMKPAWDV